MLGFLAFSFSIVFGFHNHESHVSIEEIEEEAERLAWLSSDGLNRVVKEMTQQLNDIIFLWNEEYSKPERPYYEKNKEQWDNKVYPRFKQYYDRALIAHHVCQDLYGDQE